MKKRYLFAGISGVVAGAVAAKLLMRPRDVSWPDSLEFIDHPEHSWFTRIGGVRIHYQDAGDENAPALILIHGFISSTLIWSEVFLPLAAAGFRVIAIDLPGYGYSDKPANARYTIDAQAYAVVSLMNRLEIDEATIVGASYGGAVAATIALDYPERVSRVVLIGPVNNDEPMKKLLPRVGRLPLIGDIVTPLFLGSRWVLRKRMRNMYRRSGKNLDEYRFAARHHLLATAATHRAMLRTMRRWNANRIANEAHLIRRPTLLLWGEVDEYIPLTDGVRLREAIPGARLIVFRNCGHLPHAECPQKFVEVVGDFCAPAKLQGENPVPVELRRGKRNPKS